MKKIVLILVSIFAFSQANAQPEVGSLSVTPRLGVNVSNVTDYRIGYQTVNGLTGYEKSSAAAGLHIGAEAEYQLTDLLYLSAGLDYSLQRFKVDNFVDFKGATPTEEYYVGTSDYKVKTGYVHLPVMVGCYVYNTLSVKLGLQLGLLTNATLSYSNSNIQVDATTRQRTYTSPTYTSVGLKDGMNKIDVSIPVGVAYEYEKVLLDLRYNWGLTKTFKHASGHNHWAALTVGYRFDLGKFDLPF